MVGRFPLAVIAWSLMHIDVGLRLTAGISATWARERRPVYGSAGRTGRQPQVLRDLDNILRVMEAIHGSVSPGRVDNCSDALYWLFRQRVAVSTERSEQSQQPTRSGSRYDLGWLGIRRANGLSWMTSYESRRRATE